MAKRILNECRSVDGIVYVKLRDSDQEMIVNESDWERIKHITWFYKEGYAKTCIKGERISSHRMIMNAPKGLEVDHINHNTLDNRRENLRIVSHIVNMANRARQTNNKTGINGVYFMKSNGRYYAQISVNGKRKNLGCYRTFEEAKEARINGEKKYRDPFITAGTIY